MSIITRSRSWTSKPIYGATSLVGQSLALLCNVGDGRVALDVLVLTSILRGPLVLRVPFTLFSKTLQVGVKLLLAVFLTADEHLLTSYLTNGKASYSVVILEQAAGIVPDLRIDVHA